MDQAWLQQRPHLAPLARTLEAVLKLADEQYTQGRASGDAVDYAEFEERVAHATAKVLIGGIRPSELGHRVTVLWPKSP